MTIISLWDRVEEAAAFVKVQYNLSPEVAIVLGSGLGAVKGLMPVAEAIPYTEIPHFPESTVPHHPANLYVGVVQGVSVLLFDGRLHSYEGHSAEEVSFPVLLARRLGVKTVILTNSAGGLEKSMMPGDMMMITDQLNKTGQSPLVGEHDYRFGPRYPSMHEPYSQRLQGLLRSSAQSCKLFLHEGVYAGIVGPELETPAEAKLLQQQGASVVGMSTVLETIAAVQCGLAVVGLSVITDTVGAGSGEPIKPDAAKEAAQIAVNNMIQLIKKVLKNYV